MGIGDKKIGVIGQDSLNQPIAQADLEFCIGIVFVDTSVEAASRNKVVVFIDSERLDRDLYGYVWNRYREIGIVSFGVGLIGTVVGPLSRFVGVQWSLGVECRRGVFVDWNSLTSSHASSWGLVIGSSELLGVEVFWKG